MEHLSRQTLLQPGRHAGPSYPVTLLMHINAPHMLIRHVAYEGVPGY